MLNDLQILNGNLELSFNEYNYEYTVVVDKSVNELEFSYKLADECYIRIRDNNLSKKENIVYIDVYNIDKTITYTFYVYKEDDEEVSGILNYTQGLEVSNVETVELYKLQILSISVFLILMIMFSIIFRRRKS